MNLGVSIIGIGLIALMLVSAVPPPIPPTPPTYTYGTCSTGQFAYGNQTSGFLCGTPASPTYTYASCPMGEFAYGNATTGFLCGTPASPNYYYTSCPSNQYASGNSTSGFTCSYPQNPFSTIGLVGWWPLDEGTGNHAYDITPNLNTGTLINSPPWLSGSNCKFGDCIDFTASNQYISAANSPSLTIKSKTISIAFWDNMASTGGQFGTCLSKTVYQMYCYDAPGFLPTAPGRVFSRTGPFISSWPAGVACGFWCFPSALGRKSSASMIATELAGKSRQFRFGGFVKFFGDDNAASVPDNARLASMDAGERAQSFMFQPVAKRAAIVVAGPLANFAIEGPG